MSARSYTLHSVCPRLSFLPVCGSVCCMVCSESDRINTWLRSRQYHHIPAAISATSTKALEISQGIFHVELYYPLPFSTRIIHLREIFENFKCQILKFDHNFLLEIAMSLVPSPRLHEIFAQGIFGFFDMDHNDMKLRHRLYNSGTLTINYVRTQFGFSCLSRTDLRVKLRTSGFF